MRAAPYPTDLTDREWAVLRSLLPPAKPGGRPRRSDLRLACRRHRVPGIVEDHHAAPGGPSPHRPTVCLDTIQ